MTMTVMNRHTDRRRTAGTLAGLLGLLAVATAHAQGTDYQLVEEKIRTLAPSATTVAISETPIDGLLQAQIASDPDLTEEERAAYLAFLGSTGRGR